MSSNLRNKSDFIKGKTIPLLVLSKLSLAIGLLIGPDVVGIYGERLIVLLEPTN
jgi:hypothetical protein